LDIFQEVAVGRIWQNVTSIQYQIRSDAELVELARLGNSEAYDEFVKRHQGRVYALVMNLLGHAGDAADALRDTFVAAYRSLHVVDPQDSPLTWLYRHALREAFARVHARHGGDPMMENGEAS
jgi:DNA-directed RNA polymerase specialized sigma24 family protein